MIAILRLIFLGIAIFFLALAVNVGMIDGFLGIDYTVLGDQAKNMFAYSFYTLFVAFMMMFAFIRGDT